MLPAKSKKKKEKDNRSTVVFPQFSTERSRLQVNQVCFLCWLQGHNTNTEFHQPFPIKGWRMQPVPEHVKLTVRFLTRSKDETASEDFKDKFIEQRLHVQLIRTTCVN